MADPKYANLPGIAHDQPDVFETSDLPESEQHLEGVLHDDEVSDSVETLHLSAQEAMGRFKGKHLDSSGVDFSDRLRPSRQKKGYICWSGDFELAGPGETETPLQKYHRLNFEVRELMEELEESQKKTSGASEGLSGVGALASVAAKVSSLKDELVKMNLGRHQESALADTAGGGKGETVLAHLEELKNAPEVKKDQNKKSLKESTTTSSTTTYELLMRPEKARLEEAESLARLDKRLEVLEQALGTSQESMSSLSVETSQKSVLGALSVLSARTALFSPEHLDHIEGRLAALQSKMNAVAEKKSIIDDQEKLTKINELYEIAGRAQAIGQVLPAVVDRLEALQGLHERALNFSQTLSDLENAQQRLSNNLSSNESLLKETQKKFSENIDSIQDNFQAVEKRLDNLAK